MAITDEKMFYELRIQRALIKFLIKDSSCLGKGSIERLHLEKIVEYQ